MKCACCGSSLLTSKPRCAYCGTIANVDLLGKHHYSSVVPEVPRPCPNCQEILKTINVGEDSSPFLIERCESCLGLFFDPGELDSLIEHHVRAIFSVDRIALAGLAQERPEDSVRYRKCPVCSTLMNRINFGSRSGVIIDSCRNHGIFLDAGELHHILKWVRAGGSIAAGEDEEDQRQTDQRQQAYRKTDQAGGSTLSPLPPTQKGEDDLMDQAVEFLLSLFGSPRI